MNKNISMEEHLKTIKKKTNYLVSRICWIPNSRTTIDNKILLWKALVRPIITYGSLLINVMKKTYIDKWISLIRTSLRKTLGIQKCFPKETLKIIL